MREGGEAGKEVECAKKKGALTREGLEEKKTTLMEGRRAPGTTRRSQDFKREIKWKPTTKIAWKKKKVRKREQRKTTKAKKASQKERERKREKQPPKKCAGGR